MPKTIGYFLLSLWLLAVVCGQFAQANEQEPHAPQQPAAVEPDLVNGKTIYEKGKHAKGANITFNGGPYWLRTEIVGCSTCHGPKGLGNIQPTLCVITTPPITVKSLQKNGYTLADSDGNASVNGQSLKQAIRTGFKPDGFEMDYCMPRWKFSNKDFQDLLGYLHALDQK